MSNLPNLITIARILLVPVAIWLLLSADYMVAFVVFVAAGVSDAIDGYLARRFDWKSELGSYLDPLADKVLLVSIYIVLGFIDAIPVWLVILVVTRDLLIVGAVVLAWLMEKPVQMQPLFISKFNTALQISFAGAVLFLLGFNYVEENLFRAGAMGVSAFTVASGALYMRDWLRHMNQTEIQPGTGA
jgi:cardiolipin synthase (CMP-forming)